MVVTTSSGASRASLSSDDGPLGPYRDLAAEGHDLYDGLGVPMVAAFTGDRRVLAGWLAGNGWGGHRKCAN